MFIFSLRPLLYYSSAFIGITASPSAFLALSLSSLVPVMLHQLPNAPSFPEASLSVCLFHYERALASVFRRETRFLDWYPLIQQPPRIRSDFLRRALFCLLRSTLFAAGCYPGSSAIRA